MFVIQRSSGTSYWSKDEGWDELSSANKFESEEDANKVASEIPEDEIKIMILEDAIAEELDTTPIPLRNQKK